VLILVVVLDAGYVCMATWFNTSCFGICIRVFVYYSFTCFVFRANLPWSLVQRKVQTVQYTIAFKIRVSSSVFVLHVLVKSTW